jgi:two-component system sensor histidine kinase DesK
MMTEDLTMSVTRATAHQSSVGVIPPRVLWLGWVIWLPFFVPGILALIRARPPAVLAVITLFCFAVFAALYIWAAWRNARDLGTLPFTRYREKGRTRWPAIIAMAALSVLIGFLSRLYGAPDWSAFIFTSAYVGGSLRPVRAIETNAVVIVLCVAAELFAGLPISDVPQPVFIISMVTFVTITWVSAIVAGHELRAAQGEIARLATTTERLRISRDLHDLLGHQLSLIALKSELSRRLLEADPARASVEMAEVERLVRSTLQEVREAVSRYRTPSLAGEMHAAREILAAAGIAYTGHWDAAALTGLPEQQEEELAWVVREGVTNVIRHSRARSCIVALARDDGEVSLEIIDDGPAAGTEGPGLTGQAAGTPGPAHTGAPAVDEGPWDGSGLRGIRERVTGLGGWFEAGFLARGQFVVRVRMPLPRGGERGTG